MKELTLDQLRAMGYDLTFNKNGGLNKVSNKVNKERSNQTIKTNSNEVFDDPNKHLHNIDTIIYNENDQKGMGQNKNKKNSPLIVIIMWAITIMIIYFIVK